MKKLSFLLFLFLSTSFFAQENLFQKVKDDLKKQYPELVLENKLIFINVWSPNVQESREANIQLNKAATTYEFAKLKGGKKGVIAVVVCNGDKNLEQTTLGKDKVVKPLILNTAEISSAGFSNIIFDSEGNEVKKNIKPSDIFETVHQLITR